MDRAMLLSHLEEAERHVAQGQRHIADQEARIAELDRDGHDTAEARKLLANFHASQSLHVEHRDRLLTQLGQ